MSMKVFLEDNSMGITASGSCFGLKYAIILLGSHKVLGWMRKPEHINITVATTNINSRPQSPWTIVL